MSKHVHSYGQKPIFKNRNSGQANMVKPDVRRCCDQTGFGLGRTGCLTDISSRRRCSSSTVDLLHSNSLGLPKQTGSSGRVSL